MTKEKILRREGFWTASMMLKGKLPFPVPYNNVWPGKHKFLRALKKIQNVAEVNHYRGWSTCRICSKHNGSTEYEYKGWVWPEGFMHYVSTHNVRPSLAFQEFIINKEIK